MSDLVGGIANGFGSLLQQAYWRGVPFSVVSQEVRKGRKIARHDYPFRDSGWAEDMGRALRTYRFTGYLLGDLAPVMQLALDAAIETPGPGLLIHPTLGAVHVVLLSSATSVHKERLRVISVSFEFIEAGSSLIPSIITDTINKVLDKVSSALSFISEDLVAVAVLAAGIGVAAFSEAGQVTGDYTAQCATAAADPAGLVAMAAGLPAPDGDTVFGRYAGGSAVAVLPAGTTVATLQAQLADQRQAVAASGVSAQQAAAGLTADTTQALAAAVAGVTEATRAAMTSPADQVRVMLRLAVYGYSDGEGGAGLSGLIAQVRDALSALCRRAAVLSLARASAAYLPASYDEAVALRETVADALDVEITAAGDAGEDATYLALEQVRAAVIQDLTARGAALPLVVSIVLPTNLPSLVVAYRRYQDASRADDIAARARAIHPAFCAAQMRVLAA